MLLIKLLGALFVNCRIFLFGESERGELCSPVNLRSLPELFDRLGHPPINSQAIDYAVQTLLAGNELIFYRIAEEGFSKNDYMQGVKLLYSQGKEIGLSAICLPGVGDCEIIDSVSSICHKMKSLLILSERDLYDFLTT